MDHKFFEQVFWGNTVKDYCFFLGIILLGLVFKRLVSKLFSVLLYRLFKRFAENTSGDTFIALLLKPIEAFLSFATAYLAVNQLRYPLDETLYRYTKVVGKAKEKIPVSIGEFIDKIFLFMIIVSVFWIVLRIIDFMSHVLLYKAEQTQNRGNGQLVPFLKELIKTIICFIGFFVLLGFVFEINVLTLITGLGIGGIAIALAAKESLENLLGSFTIFLDKPFTVGDLVKVDGVEGTVEKVGFRSTLIRSSDKTMVTIPNKAMIDGVLENITLRNLRKVKFQVGVVYETTDVQLKQIIRDIKDALEAEPEIMKDYTVHLDSFGDSAINIDVTYFVSSPAHADYLKIKERINFSVMEIVKNNRSDFAYPTQRQV
ncbi:mechanosensitive ion channel family protein [Pedobacter sp. SYP-B3415]|uniref:mechanosensitive ion channel family protein n=1 Tax=Pedobacter sp. SYP-B3415 TaxID=2496641 RepID=UPI0013EA8733|nr:mechanosensitive ion channel family protein [Pedobacter sp. SYP-B3415]